MSLPEPLSQLAQGPIFVVGQPRSGTTWVYDILKAHPEVAGVLESWLFTEHGVIGPFNFNHWDPARLKLYVDFTGHALGLAQLVSREEMVADIRDLASRWLAKALKPHHRYLVEKTPPHLGTAEVIAEVFPEARFVHVLRDGRDVVVSLKAATRWSPGWRKSASSIYSSARMWKQAVELARKLQGTLDERFFELRYEEISADPPTAVRRLFSFCGIPHDDELVARVVEETNFASRFTGGEDRFRRAGKVGEWRERFGLVDAAAFHRAAGRILLQTGYESNPGWWVRNPLRGRRR